MNRKQTKLPEKLDDVEYPRKAVPCENRKDGVEMGRNYAALLTSPELAAYRLISRL
jgi:hypothetical protein